MVSQVAFSCETVDLQEWIVDAVRDSSVGGLGIEFQVQNDFPSACVILLPSGIWVLMRSLMPG